MAKNLRVRLIVILLFLGLMPAIIVNTVFYFRTEKREREIIYRDSIRLLESISGNLNSFFQFHTGQIETLANDQSISLPVSLLANTEPNSSAWRTSLTTVLNSINRVAKEYEAQYLDLFATSHDYILFNPKATLTADDSPKEFIQTALATTSPTWSPWIWSEQLQTYLMFVAVPVYNITGDVVGTVGAAISSAQVDELMQNIASPNQLEYDAYLVRPNGLLLSSIPYEDYASFTHKVDTDIITSATQIVAGVNANPFIDLEYRSFSGHTVLGYAKLVTIGSEPAILIVETNKNAALAGVYQTQVLFAAIFVGSALVIGLASYFLSRNITKPIAQLVAYSEQAASGDLSQQIEDKRSDEIGKLMTAFKKMTENLREMISLINGAAHNASSASEELSAAAAENSATIEEIVSNISSYAQTTKEVHRITEKMAAQAKNVDQLSHKGSQQMIASDKVMMEILDSSKASQEKIAKLEQAVNQISEVVNIISQIADQTNLLALNAAIEAARAGSHGRGFAVVADEVRNLAEETQASIGTIMNYISQLRKGTNEVVSVINSNNEKIAAGAKSLKQTQEDFEEIIASVNDTVQLINEVNTFSMEIEAGMAELAASSEQQAASMEQIATNAETVAKMAEEMARLVNRFKL